MDFLLSEPAIRLVGGLAFLFIGYSIWMGNMKAQGLPDGYRSPVLALELVKSGADIDQIVKAQSGAAATFIKRSTHKDFGFIAVYALSFIAVSLLLAKINRDYYLRLMGCFAAGSVALAALLDIAENRGMLRAIAGEASDSLAASIRHASLAKWALLFVFALLAGLLLVLRQDFFAIPAGFLLVAALLGFYGVLANFFRPKFYWTFPVAMISLGIGVLILAVIFSFWPAKFLARAVR
jgi:hypothetical protein